MSFPRMCVISMSLSNVFFFTIKSITLNRYMTVAKVLKGMVMKAWMPAWIPATGCLGVGGLHVLRAHE